MSAPDTKGTIPELSARQRDVLTRIATDRPAKIARDLKISRQRVSDILIKLQHRGYVARTAWGWEPTTKETS